MSVVRSPNNVECLDSTGLSDDECGVIRGEAYRLMADGRSLGIGEELIEDGAKSVFVLDGHGNRYTVARNVGAYLLLDPAFGVISVRRQFAEIVQDLRTSI